MALDRQSIASLADGNRLKAKGNGRPEKWYAWLRWGDYVLYVLIGGLAILLLVLAPGAGQMPGSGDGAALSLDDRVVVSWTSAELSGQGERQVEANGYHYTISWANGRIRFSTADCPDKVCVRTGWISHWGEIAACVPGHLILKVNGGSDRQPDSTSEVDVIVK